MGTWFSFSLAPKGQLTVSRSRSCKRSRTILRIAPKDNGETDISPALCTSEDHRVELTVVGELVDLIDTVVCIDFVPVFDHWIFDVADLISIVDKHSQLLQIIREYWIWRELVGETAKHVDDFVIERKCVLIMMISKDSGHGGSEKW